MIRKMKKSTIAIILTIDVIIGIITILLYAFDIFNGTVFTILFFIALIVFTTMTSALMGFSLEKKMLKKREGTHYHVSKLPELTGDKVKVFEVNYGKVYLLLNNKEIYYVAVIEDVNLFFSDKQEAIPFKIDDRKYQKACQFFIFHNPDSKNYRKLQIMNYQAERFFVASFNYFDQNEVFYQTDKVSPNLEFKPMFDKLLELLDIHEEIKK